MYGGVGEGGEEDVRHVMGLGKGATAFSWHTRVGELERENCDLRAVIARLERELRAQSDDLQFYKASWEELTSSAPCPTNPPASCSVDAPDDAFGGAPDDEVAYWKARALLHVASRRNTSEGRSVNITLKGDEKTAEDPQPRRCGVGFISPAHIEGTRVVRAAPHACCTRGVQCSPPMVATSHASTATDDVRRPSVADASTETSHVEEHTRLYRTRPQTDEAMRIRLPVHVGVQCCLVHDALSGATRTLRSAACQTMRPVAASASTTASQPLSVPAAGFLGSAMGGVGGSSAAALTRVRDVGSCTVPVSGAGDRFSYPTQSGSGHRRPSHPDQRRRKSDSHHHQTTTQRGGTDNNQGGTDDDTWQPQQRLRWRDVSSRLQSISRAGEWVAHSDRECLSRVERMALAGMVPVSVPHIKLMKHCAVGTDADVTQSHVGFLDEVVKAVRSELRAAQVAKETSSEACVAPPGVDGDVETEPCASVAVPTPTRHRRAETDDVMSRGESRRWVSADEMERLRHDRDRLQRLWARAQKAFLESLKHVQTENHLLRQLIP